MEIGINSTKIELQSITYDLQTSMATKTELQEMKSELQTRATKTELQEAKSTLQTSINTRATQRELQISMVIMVILHIYLWNKVLNLMSLRNNFSATSMVQSPGKTDFFSILKSQSLYEIFCSYGVLLKNLRISNFQICIKKALEASWNVTLRFCYLYPTTVVKKISVCHKSKIKKGVC